MRREVLRCALVAALVAGWALAAAAVVADGIPTPMPGAVVGPSGDTLTGIAMANGLACQPDPGAPSSEAFCTNATGSPDIEIETATFYTTPALVLVASAGAPSPISGKARSFLVGMAGPFCAGGTDAVATFYDASIAKGPNPQGYTFDDPSCHLVFGANSTAGRDFRVLTAFSTLTGAGPAPTPSAAAVPTPGTSTAPTPTSAPTPPPIGGASGGSGGGAFAASIARPGAISTDLAIIAQSAALALLVVLLMPFPATLFNSTLEKHYDEVRGWFRLGRRASPAAGDGSGEHGSASGRSFWASPIGIAGFVAISALVYALLDPGLGFTLGSLTEIVGIGLGIVVTAVAFDIPPFLAHRRIGSAWHVHVLPGTILVGIACVLISRVTGFLPGYVYGLILGVVFAQELSAAERGRWAAIAGLEMLALAILAWLALSTLDPSDDGVLPVAVRTVLAAVMVGGLEGVVFGLVPLRFLKGEALFAWNKLAWGVVFGLGVFAFAHILINPASGYLADSSRTPLFTIVALLVGFGAVSVAFWAYFRFRPGRPPALEAAAVDAEAPPPA